MSQARANGLPALQTQALIRGLVFEGTLPKTNMELAQESPQKENCLPETLVQVFVCGFK